MLNIAVTGAPIVLSAEATWDGCRLIGKWRQPKVLRIAHDVNTLWFAACLVTVAFVKWHQAGVCPFVSVEIKCSFVCIMK